MKDNIYDLVASELILRGSSTSSSGSGASSGSLDITSTIGSNEVQAGYNVANTFTSSVGNIPSGYAISAGTHIMTFPNSVTTGSSSESIADSKTVYMPTAGDTFVVSSTVTLISAGNPDITLTGTITITAVLPLYYGVADYTSTPGVSLLDSLSQAASSSTSFTLTSSAVGRLYIVVPTTLDDIKYVTDNNGMVITEFTKATNVNLDYYVLNHDTQFTGDHNKIFTINFS